MIPLITLIDEMTARLDAAGLSYGHGAADARADAIFLTLEGLDLSEDVLMATPTQLVGADDAARVKDLVQQRIQTRKPSPYLVSRAWLVGVPFYVDERVLVPRSFIAEIMADGFFSGGDGALIDDPHAVTRVLDLCTGSGCLAILAADLFPNAVIDAVDLSGDAIDVARINVDMYGLSDRINLLRGDLFAPVSDRQYDLIITNPPYVADPAMAVLPPEYRHEPFMALAGGGVNGMDLPCRILSQAGRHLRKKGGIIAEIGAGRAALGQIYPDHPFTWIDTTNSDGEVFWLPAETFQD